MGRFAVFIDGGYFRRVLRQFGEPRISYLRLSEVMACGEERLRTYYYDCAPHVGPAPTQEDKDRQASFDRFRHALEMEPRFQVRLGRLDRYETPQGPLFHQKMVEVLLSLDLVKLALEHQIQRAVLVAGDSDFVPAIRMARDAGTVVQLYYHIPPPTRVELMEGCDERFAIDQALVDRILRDGPVGR